MLFLVCYFHTLYYIIILLLLKCCCPGAYRYPASIDPLAFICERLGGEEVEKQIKIRLNGVDKQVQAIEKAGHNYVMLQDLRDSRISVDYDSKGGVPVVEVK